jgi:hypothetical protein
MNALKLRQFAVYRRSLMPYLSAQAGRDDFRGMN